MCVNNKNKNIINHIHCNTIGKSLDIADSGFTSHFLCDASNFENVQPASANAITSTIPNGEQIRSTHTATLKWPHLPPSAQTCHIFPALKNKILLSIGKFCDTGLNSAFTKSHLYIYDRSTIFLQGKIQPGNGMWYVDLQAQTPVPMSTTVQQSIIVIISEMFLYQLGCEAGPC